MSQLRFEDAECMTKEMEVELRGELYELDVIAMKVRVVGGGRICRLIDLVYERVGMGCWLVGGLDGKRVYPTRVQRY